MQYTDYFSTLFIDWCGGAIDICWQYRLSLCFRAVLEALPMLVSRHALLHPASAREETTRCPALLCVQVSCQRNSWKISQYCNTPVSPSVCSMGRFRASGFSILLLRCHQDMRLGARAAELAAEHPHPAKLVHTQRSGRTTQGTPHSPPSITKWRIMNYRNKNKAAENVFSAFLCDHISQLICVISLSFNKTKLKLLLYLCPALQFCCILTILLSHLSASAMVTLAFLMLSSFINEILLNCLFLTEKMPYKDPLPLIVYNKLKPTSEML